MSEFILRCSGGRPIDECACKRPHAPPALRWTTVAPTVPGWYFIEETRPFTGERYCRRVQYVPEDLLGSPPWPEGNYFTGPIPLPSDPAAMPGTGEG